MNDVISRVAVIDAIVSVTVFPDADYIKNLCENPSNSEDWLGGVCEVINAVEEVNAVDAIPVEWLRSQLKNNPNDIESVYDDICINELIDRWQKEQEAR